MDGVSLDQSLQVGILVSLEDKEGTLIIDPKICKDFRLMRC
jgi:hypothetical protein